MASPDASIDTSRPPVRPAGPVRMRAPDRDWTPRAPVPIAPAIIGLFHAVQALRTLAQPFVIQFLAPHAGAGTSSIAEGFARAAAGAGGGRVLLVDAAMVSAAAAMPAAAGLLDTEAEQPLAAVRQADHASGNLFRARLAAGLRADVALPTERVADCIAGLRAGFQIVVLDCASLDVMPQSAMLARFCDGTALVVEAERTTGGQVSAAQKAIAAMGGLLIGAVFNRSGRRTPPQRGPGWGAARLAITYGDD